MQKKRCPKCKKNKLLKDYNRDKTTKSGHKSRCRSCEVVIRKESYERNRIKRIESTKKHWKKYPERVLAYQKKRRIEIKEKVISGYGGKCACCGESIFEFLTLEHINKDGKEHRKLKGGSQGTYRDVIKRNFPKEYTILCCNCNYAERFGKICPHKLAKGGE